MCFSWKPWFAPFDINISVLPYDYGKPYTLKIISEEVKVTIQNQFTTHYIKSNN